MAVNVRWAEKELASLRQIEQQQQTKLQVAQVNLYRIQGAIGWLEEQLEAAKPKPKKQADGQDKDPAPKKK